ncbi:ORF27 [White sturgeon adenovirus 1]|uniref:ORF27 n=1 Tax=White sturgeon adenovirus 1 TaxID=2580388 RepID=A0A4P8PIY0_9ADEN|nr:ORF27 [White sturgeon adenovirus 1]QCQ84167.1 ORF27 [White sturgeon adenovirus 1]
MIELKEDGPLDAEVDSYCVIDPPNKIKCKDFKKWLLSQQKIYRYSYQRVRDNYVIYILPERQEELRDAIREFLASH